ncbi:hypothetical protein GCM10008922_41190 [Faecalicatena contorta]
MGMAVRVVKAWAWIRNSSIPLQSIRSCIGIQSAVAVLFPVRDYDPRNYRPDARSLWGAGG